MGTRAQIPLGIEKSSSLCLCKALNIEREPNFGPDRPGDIKHSNADISKARRLLGYDPDYDFSRGIELAINWYKENL